MPRGRRVTVDVFRQNAGRRVVGERRVARFARRTRSFRWSGRGREVGPGHYNVRLRVGGTSQRFTFVRRDRRFVARPGFERRGRCGLLARFKLQRPVFGGSTATPLRFSYRLAEPARVRLVVRRGSRVVRRYRSRSRRAARTYRLRIPVARLARGDHRVTLTARTASGRRLTARLTSRRL